MALGAATWLGMQRLLRQWGVAEDDAIRFEVESGKAVFGLDFRSGAARFVAGAGRHGEDLDRRP